MSEEINAAYESFCSIMGLSSLDDPKTVKEVIRAINGILEFTVFVGPMLTRFTPDGELLPEDKEIVAYKIDKLTGPNGNFFIKAYKVRRYSLKVRLVMPFKKTLHAALFSFAYFKAWRAGNL